MLIIMTTKVLIYLLAAVGCSCSFKIKTTKFLTARPLLQSDQLLPKFLDSDTDTSKHQTNNDNFQSLLFLKAAAGSSAFNIIFPIQDAFAKGGEYGILEGRTASMLHPLTMLALFATSIYAGSLG